MVRLMDGKEVKRALIRLSHQILEKDSKVANLVIMGIQRRGVPLAERISVMIEEIKGTVAQLLGDTGYVRGQLISGIIDMDSKVDYKATAKGIFEQHKEFVQKIQELMLAIDSLAVDQDPQATPASTGGNSKKELITGKNYLI